jgi:hypothetical protein
LISKTIDNIDWTAEAEAVACVAADQQGMIKAWKKNTQSKSGRIKINYICFFYYYIDIEDLSYLILLNYVHAN